MLKPFVAILMGSDSDLATMKGTTEILTSLKIPFEIKISSAHRTPERTVAYVKEAPGRGCEVFICAAGLAAHLAGVVAAHTLKPVIGVPLSSPHLEGLDALLSTVQMPAGVPVACVAIGSPGAQNAAYLSAQILALKDPEIAARLVATREEMQKKVMEKDEKLATQFAGSRA